jgi:transglutaminase-like putative cysteine protease
MRIQNAIAIAAITAAFSACQLDAGDLKQNQALEDLTPRAVPGSSTAQSNGNPNQTESIPTVNPTLSILRSDQYDIQQRLKLVNRGTGSPSKLNLWMALIADDRPYQEVIQREISPADHQIVTDEHGNIFAEFEFSDMPPGSEIQITVDYQVKTNWLKYDLSSCEGELPDFYNKAELHIESRNPQITSLSDQLIANHQTICDQVRAFYDFVGEELVYSFNGGNWGAQATFGEMGADCTEYSSLMIALSRAAGIPARYVEGLWYSLDGDEGRNLQEHAWLEVYLPGIGWTAMDPTLGRSSITRNEFFAQLPSDHIIVTHGRNPSTLRGASYFTYLYWPGNSTEIIIDQAGWTIHLIGE